MGRTPDSLDGLKSSLPEPNQPRLKAPAVASNLQSAIHLYRKRGLLRRWFGCERLGRVVNARVDGQLASTTAASHSALAARFTSFVGRPLVGSTLLMRRATTLAGDLALFFGRH
jgi:hypothetical protein